MLVYTSQCISTGRKTIEIKVCFTSMTFYFFTMEYFLLQETTINTIDTERNSISSVQIYLNGCLKRTRVWINFIFFFTFSRWCYFAPILTFPECISECIVMSSKIPEENCLTPMWCYKVAFLYSS